VHRNVPIKRLDGLLGTERGLEQAEIDSRRYTYGTNDILHVSEAGWLTLLWETARDPMLWFLLATAVLFFLLGNNTEAIILLIAILPLIGMDLYLHRRTQATTEGLASRLAATAHVRRAGAELAIPATQLVAGELVLLEPGDQVPADGILLSSESIQVDESALTGEAYPVRKQAIEPLNATLAEVQVDVGCWVYAGTRILTGNGYLRVIYTGAETLYGEIVQSAMHGKHARTPLQTAITSLVGVLLIAATVLCLLLAWIRLQQGFGIVDALLSAVTLAVAALPEEFPVVFTFFLGVGVFRLAQRRALVRRAVVVENIGRVSCICSDKTGTITEGRLQLTHCFPVQGGSESVLLTVAALASRSESGDPMDLAILRDAPTNLQHFTPVMTFPFTEDRKRETAIWRNGKGTLKIVSKGAPEVVLAMCELPPQEHTGWLAQVENLAAGAHKVIACAEREVDETSWAGGEPDRALHFVGLLAFEDPVREGVIESVRNCQESGIHVVMVTGDHPATAKAVADEIGLGRGNPVVLEGEQLEAMLLHNAVDLSKVDIIARAIPAQKLGLVRGLQGAGEVVAVTGDGVNDVPALQAADVGLAMGERGTRSARDVAAIVLLDDNFRTITRAIAEGRQLFRNLKLSFAYLLMVHIPLVLTAALIPLAGYPLLYLPIHIVWLELIIHPTALLVFQEMPVDEQLLPQAKTKRLRFFLLREWLVIATVGTLVTLLIMLGYERSLGIGHEVEHARAMTLITLTSFSGMLTLLLSGWSNRMARIIAFCTIGVSLLLVQTPVLSHLLHLKPLHIDDLLLAAGGALSISLFAWIGRFRRAR